MRNNHQDKFMHSHAVLKHAVPGALGTEDGRGDIVGCFSIIDPHSALDLVEIAETRIINEDVPALHQV